MKPGMDAGVRGSGARTNTALARGPFSLELGIWLVQDRRALQDLVRNLLVGGAVAAVVNLRCSP